jgi:oxygen-independent coproporphyrinogen-3 oxidase
MGLCGLYIHVPFCTARCGYCDFYSVVPDVGRAAAPLVDRLQRELELRVRPGPTRPDTVFVGGGTPTVLPRASLAALLAAASEAAVTPPVEFSVEANPESLDGAKADTLAAAGVDRVSIGAQSFHEVELRFLERIHTVRQTETAVETARRAGIGRINLDLIFGIPGQTRASWRDSLQRAVDLGVEHLACYGLTYESGTRLTGRLQRGLVRRCDEDLEADLYDDAIDALAEAGFEQYEISNFARPGGRCRHNLVYWQGGSYVGVGPSAAGYVDGVRYRNVADVDEYLRMIDECGHAEVERERVTGITLAGEAVMLGLRLIDGIDVPAFARRTGIDPFIAFARTLDAYGQQRLLDVSASRIALTRRGLLVADTILTDMLAELDAHRDLAPRAERDPAAKASPTRGGGW